MKIKKLTVASLLIGSAFLAQQASAQWTLMDNLTTGHTAGDLAGQTASDGSTWAQMGAAGGVNIGTAAGGGQAAISDTTGTILGADYLPLYTPIAGGATATVFFQFDMGSSVTANDNVDWTVENLTGSTATAGGDASGASDTIYLNSNIPSGRPGIEARNGAGFTPMYSAASTAFTPLASTIYSVWLVIVNPSASAPSYNIYMAGGALGSSPVEMGNSSAYTGFSFGLRNASNGTTINDFVFGPGGTFTAPGGGEALYDLYEASGMLTTDPIPEPSTTTLFGALGAVLVALRRRIALRRRNSQV